MRFRVQSEDLKRALDVLTLVTPSAVTAKGIAGYLFVVKDGVCSAYSRDSRRRVKTELPVVDVEGEGSFLFLSTKIAAMRYLEGWIDLEYGQDGDLFWFKYTSEEGASAEWSSCDPDLMQPLDEELERASEGFSIPSATLKKGLDVTKKYAAPAADPRLGEHYKTVQLFDAKAKKEWAKGDGCLFASDHIRICYFFCEAFKGKGLSIHSLDLPCVMSFLSKCEGSVTVRPGEGVTFMTDSAGRTLGWSAHLKSHGKYAYYPLKMDEFVLSASTKILLRNLKLVRAGLDSDKDKVRVEYSHADKSIRFRASDGQGKVSAFPVSVVPILDEETGAGKSALSDDFADNFNINHLIELVDSVEGHQVELRAAPMSKGGKKYVLLRAIERFWLDSKGKVRISSGDAEEGEAHLCEVTRFMPSKG